VVTHRGPDVPAPNLYPPRRKTVANNTPITIRMEQDKVTKGTYRYAAVEEHAAVGTVYISKSAFPDSAPRLSR